MSEILAGLASIVVGGGVWATWLRRLHAVDPLVARPGRRWVVPSALGSFTLINVIVLRTLAARDVREEPVYIGFYLVLGLGVSAVALTGLTAFGIRPADISQRGNRAAGLFVVLAMIAFAFAYAGANIGDGPGFHVVLFCTLVSFGALFALLAAHTMLARTAYRILVDRDVGTAFRCGCLLVGCGIYLGRAVGGTWVSVDATLTDALRYGWPAVAFCAADVVFAWITRSREPNTGLPVDLPVGVLYIALAVVYLHNVGLPA